MGAILDIGNGVNRFLRDLTLPRVIVSSSPIPQVLLLHLFIIGSGHTRNNIFPFFLWAVVPVGWRRWWHRPIDRSRGRREEEEGGSELLLFRDRHRMACHNNNWTTKWSGRVQVENNNNKMKRMQIIRWYMAKLPPSSLLQWVQCSFIVAWGGGGGGRRRES